MTLRLSRATKVQPDLIRRLGLPSGRALLLPDLPRVACGQPTSPVPPGLRPESPPFLKTAGETSAHADERTLVVSKTYGSLRRYRACGAIPRGRDTDVALSCRWRVASCAAWKYNGRSHVKGRS